MPFIAIQRLSEAERRYAFLNDQIRPFRLWRQLGRTRIALLSKPELSKQLRERWRRQLRPRSAAVQRRTSGFHPNNHGWDIPDDHGRRRTGCHARHLDRTKGCLGPKCAAQRSYFVKILLEFLQPILSGTVWRCLRLRPGIPQLPSGRRESIVRRWIGSFSLGGIGREDSCGIAFKKGRRGNQWQCLLKSPCSICLGFQSFTTFSRRDSMRRTFLLIGLSLIFPDTMALAGLYSGPTDTTNSIDPAIPSTSTRFVEWANAIDPARTHFAPRGSTTISATATTVWAIWTPRRSPTAYHQAT